MQFAPLKQVQIHWLVDPEAHTNDFVQRPNPNNLHLQCPYPAEIGEGWIDRLSLSQEMVIYRTVHRFCAGTRSQMLALGEFKLEFTEPTFSVHTLHSGYATSRELQPRQDLNLKPGDDLFRYGEHGNFIPLVDTGSDIEMTALALTDAALSGFIGEASAKQLLADLSLALPPMVQVVAIPLHVTEPLRQCLSSGCTGQLHTLFAQSKVLEYLWRLTRFTASGREPGRASSRELEIIQALYDYLMQLEGQLPTLRDLSKMFGTSPQTLNRGFLREYGHSIYATVTSHRLNQAHKALVDGDLPIKTIATRLGYSHVNHFNYAFRKKFGYTPGSLRRKH